MPLVFSEEWWRLTDDKQHFRKIYQEHTVLLEYFFFF